MDDGGDEEDDRAERDCGEDGTGSHCTVSFARVAGWESRALGDDGGRER